jgi:hypothetical protein
MNKSTHRRDAKYAEVINCFYHEEIPCVLCVSAVKSVFVAATNWLYRRHIYSSLAIQAWPGSGLPLCLFTGTWDKHGLYLIQMH